jgi:hypothetical protein
VNVAICGPVAVGSTATQDAEEPVLVAYAGDVEAELHAAATYVVDDVVVNVLGVLVDDEDAALAHDQ